RSGRPVREAEEGAADRDRRWGVGEAVHEDEPAVRGAGGREDRGEGDQPLRRRGAEGVPRTVVPGRARGSKGASAVAQGAHVNMTVGDLRAQLAKLDAQAEVLIAVNGNIALAAGVAAATGTEFVVIRGRAKHQENPGSRFSVGEEVVIGYL